MAIYNDAGIHLAGFYVSWADIIFLVEDLQGEPNRTIPRIILTSLLIVSIAYILTNLAYFSVLSVPEITDTPAIAYQMGIQISAHVASLSFLPIFLAAGVAVSATGSCHGSIMAGKSHNYDLSCCTILILVYHAMLLCYYSMLCYM